MIDLTHMWVALKVIAFAVGLGYMIYSVFKPDPLENLKWYDRALRAIGAAIVIFFLAYGLYRRSHPR